MTKERLTFKFSRVEKNNDPECNNPGYEFTKMRLQGLRAAIRSLEASTDELRRVHDLRTHITTTLSECTSGGRAFEDKRAEATVRLVEIEQEVYDRVTAYADAYKRLQMEVNCLRSENQRGVLYRKYVLDWGWKRIAKDLNISVDSAYHLHRRGVENLSRLHGENG